MPTHAFASLSSWLLCWCDKIGFKVCFRLNKTLFKGTKELLILRFRDCKLYSMLADVLVDSSPHIDLIRKELVRKMKHILCALMSPE